MKGITVKKNEGLLLSAISLVIFIAMIYSPAGWITLIISILSALGIPSGIGHANTAMTIRSEIETDFNAALRYDHQKYYEIEDDPIKVLAEALAEFKGIELDLAKE